MENLFDDSKSLIDKLVKFSEHDLNENEQKILDSVLAIYQLATSKENASSIIGADLGFLAEINEASEKEGEVTAMTTLVCLTAVTAETPVY